MYLSSEIRISTAIPLAEPLRGRLSPSQAVDSSPPLRALQQQQQRPVLLVLRERVEDGMRTEHCETCSKRVLNVTKDSTAAEDHLLSADLKKQSKKRARTTSEDEKCLSDAH